MARGSRGNELLLASLAAGDTNVEAAKKAKMAVTTVQRRLRDPDFVRELDGIRRQIVDRTADQLCNAAEQVVPLLFKLTKSKKNLNVQLGAIRLVLEMAFRVREVISYQRRIEELEDKLRKLEGTAADAPTND